MQRRRGSHSSMLEPTAGKHRSARTIKARQCSHHLNSASSYRAVPPLRFARMKPQLIDNPSTLAGTGKRPVHFRGAIAQGALLIGVDDVFNLKSGWVQRWRCGDRRPVCWQWLSLLRTASMSASTIGIINDMAVKALAWAMKLNGNLSLSAANRKNGCWAREQVDALKNAFDAWAMS